MHGVCLRVLFGRHGIWHSASFSSSFTMLCVAKSQLLMMSCSFLHKPVSLSLSSSEQLLRDEDRPSAIHASLKDSATFHLRYRTSGLVRVYYGSEEAGDRHQTTFQSLIVTPSMTSRDVTQLAVARLFPQDKPEDFDLVIRRRGQGERVLAGDECPLYLQQQNIQLDLRRKRQQVCVVERAESL